MVDAPLENKLWLEGIAGSGKTSSGIARLLRLLEQGLPAETILLFLPQRSLAQPYREALRGNPGYGGGQLAVHTIGSLSKDMVETFWFLIAERAGFAHPQDLPNFLSLEMVQYFMTRAIETLVAQRDYFKSVRIDRARLYSQIVDNMNKAALVGFPINEIGTRLQSALGGSVEQAHIYADAQACAIAFREYCLQRNLLDFSLTIELFSQLVLALPVVRDNLRGRFQHLIADNVEEDNPAAHRFLMSLLPSCKSALLICDQDAGFRRFLGADPESADRLRGACDSHVALADSFVMSDEIAALGAHLSAPLAGEEAAQEMDFRPALFTEAHRYHPQMIEWVADEIGKLVFEKGIKPQEIAVLAPYMSDSLRFSLFDNLRKRGLSARSHRPSRALRDEPAARALLSLARLAHPGWGVAPVQFDLAFALTQAIAGLDLVRAKLLCDVLYRDGRLHPFSGITNAAMQDRITYDIGKRYDQLRDWIEAYTEGEPIAALDIFLRRLYSEVLARRGFGMHADINAGNISRNLVDSARGFRWSLDFLPRYDDDIRPGARFCADGRTGAHRQFLPARLDSRSRGQHLYCARLYLLAGQSPCRCAILAEYQQRGLVEPLVSAADASACAQPRLADRRSLERSRRTSTGTPNPAQAAAGFDAALSPGGLSGLQRAGRKRLRGARSASGDAAYGAAAR